jgi:hypothetical protein
MTQHIPSEGRRAQAKVWAVLTLAMAMTASGAVAIANAQGTGHQSVRPDKGGAKSCSGSGSCIEGSNSGDGAGVQGNANTFFGVLGEASGANAGVGGYNFDGTSGASGVYGQSDNGFGVYGFAAASSGYGLFSQGNAFIQGLLYTSGDCHSGCSRTRHQASFAARTSQPTIDDVGEGTLRAGVARVALAPDFANTIDATRPYIVLLTPEGDAALYVTNRTPGGFEVRQIGGGRSSVTFAYRIIAKPYGAADERLPFKTVADPTTVDPRHAAH